MTTKKDAAAVKYRHIMFGSIKTGFLELKKDGRMIFKNGETFKGVRFHASDVTGVALESASEVSRRPTVARAAGGALAGGVLLGPVGLLAGLGLGALAQKKEGGEVFLVLDLVDGRTVMVGVPRNRVSVAELMVAELERRLA